MVCFGEQKAVLLHCRPKKQKVPTSDYFVLTNVKFTDSTGNAVRATINTNTFEIVTDENGGGLIPLFSTGSLVVAREQG